MSSNIRTSAAADLRDALYKWASKYGGEVVAGCGSCTFARRTGPFQCDKFKTVPPLEVILKGCEAYSDVDDIPF